MKMEKKIWEKIFKVVGVEGFRSEGAEVEGSEVTMNKKNMRLNGSSWKVSKGQGPIRAGSEVTMYKTKRPVMSRASVV